MTHPLPPCAPGMCHADPDRQCGKACRYARAEFPSLDTEGDPLAGARGILNGLILSVALVVAAVVFGHTVSEFVRWLQ